MSHEYDDLSRQLSSPGVSHPTRVEGGEAEPEDALAMSYTHTGLSLYWRVCVVNAAVLVAAAGLLAFTPITVSWPIKAAQAVYLAIGLVVVLLGNLFLIRTALRPLHLVMAEMESADLLEPSGHVMVGGPPELRRLSDAYRRMLIRFERERLESGRRAMGVVEAEREHVSRELHDEIGQTLTAVLLLLGQAAARTGVKQELDEAQAAVRSALQDLRRVADRLRPDTLEMLGLPAALASLVETFCDRTGLESEAHFSDGYIGLTNEAELAFYRIAQESLTNVARHADATMVDVSLRQDETGTRLRVTDDGCGIDSLERHRPGGIRGMRERAGMVNAQLSIGRSPRGRGTEVALFKPWAR